MGSMLNLSCAPASKEPPKAAARIRVLSATSRRKLRRTARKGDERRADELRRRSQMHLYGRRRTLGQSGAELQQGVHGRIRVRARRPRREGRRSGRSRLGKSVELSCQSAGENEIPRAANWTGIRVISATYGGNCGAPIGNATDAIGPACGGKRACDYTVDVNKLGDPAPRCSKSFFVKYQCGGESAVRTAAVRGEAGLGSSIHLSCAP